MNPFINTSNVQLSAPDLRGARDFKEEEGAGMTFRFGDLPAEVRNRVYEGLFKEDGGKRVNLANFKPHSITQASRLLRKESLPLFYASTPFYIISFSNFEDRYIFRNRHDPSSIFYQDDQQARIVKASGVLGIKQQVKKSIRDAGVDAIFRDVTVKVVEADPAHFNARHISSKAWDGVTMRYINLKCAQGHASVTITKGLQYPPMPIFFNKDDVDEAIQGATDEANSLASREGFKGFTLRDLEQIVNKLRYVFPAT